MAELNRLGYSCDLFVVDARRFVPQSRPRLFIVGARRPLTTENEWAGELRPPWIARFVADHPELQMHALPLRESPNEVATLRSVVERLHPRDRRWWDAERVARFRSTLSPIQSDRVDQLIRGRRLSCNLDGATENQALFGLGDAVCVPVVAWIAREYLHPLVAREKHPNLTGQAVSCNHLPHMATVIFRPRLLASLRGRANMTQGDLAYELRNRHGLKADQSQVAHWERGSYTPRASVIPALADVLGVTMEELYSDDEEEEDAATA